MSFTMQLTGPLLKAFMRISIHFSCLVSFYLLAMLQSFHSCIWRHTALQDGWSQEETTTSIVKNWRQTNVRSDRVICVLLQPLHILHKNHIWKPDKICVGSHSKWGLGEMGKFSNLYYQTFEPDSMPPYQRGEDTIFGIMTTLTSQNLI